MIEGKIADCAKQLNDVKEKMKTQKGLAYKNSQKRALMILKRRKTYEAQYNNLINQQYNLDQIAFASETIQNTVDTVKKRLLIKVGEYDEECS